MQSIYLNDMTSAHHIVSLNRKIMRKYAKKVEETSVAISYSSDLYDFLYFLESTFNFLLHLLFFQSFIPALDTTLIFLVRWLRFSLPRFHRNYVKPLCGLHNPQAATCRKLFVWNKSTWAYSSFDILMASLTFYSVIQRKMTRGFRMYKRYLD